MLPNCRKGCSHRRRAFGRQFGKMEGNSMFFDTGGEISRFAGAIKRLMVGDVNPLCSGTERRRKDAEKGPIRFVSKRLKSCDKTAQ